MALIGSKEKLKEERKNKMDLINIFFIFILMIGIVYVFIVHTTIKDAFRRKKDRILACSSINVLFGVITIPIYWYRKKMEVTPNG